MITREIPAYKPEDLETGCCPKFHPGHWEERLFDFSAYTFIKSTANSFFYKPLNMDKVMTKVMTDIQNAKASFSDRMIILSSDLSAFKAEHFFLVNGPVPGYKPEKIEGLYFCKVYDGSFSELPHFMKEFDELLRLKDRHLKDVFAYYTTCPECAKAYKHNYIALFAKVDQYFEL